MVSSIRSKVVGSGTWNNPWYVYVGIPVFALLGGILSWVFGRQLASSDLEVYLVTLLFAVVTCTLGSTIFALLDGD